LAKTKTDESELDNQARITLNLLNIVEDDASVSQRSMADDLGIALGLANAYLKRCVRKGLIKMRQAPANRYAYYLTPKGFTEKSRLTAEFLTQSFRLFRLARSESTDMFKYCQARGWRRVAFYGVGDLTEIMVMSARDFELELVAVVNGDSGATEFAGLPVVADLDPSAGADVAIVCDISRPQAAYDRARARFAAGQVLVPKFLGIPKKNSSGKGRVP
jgi:DNA-binding MarR family transcriptional regulator